MKDFKNCREISKDYYRHATSNNGDNEIFIEYRDNITPIETSKAVLYLVRDWCRIAMSQQD